MRINLNGINRYQILIGVLVITCAALCHVITAEALGRAPKKSAVPEQDKAYTQYQMAQQLYADGKHREAVEQLRGITRVSAETDSVLRYTILNGPYAARETADDYNNKMSNLSNYTSDQEQLIYIGGFLLTNKKYAEAKRVLLQAVQLPPTSKELQWAWAYLGEIAYMNDKLPDAFEYYNRAIMDEQGQVAQFQHLSGKDISEFVTYYGQGLLSYGDKDLRQALVHYKAALEAGERDPDPAIADFNKSGLYYAMGLAYEELGKRQPARTWYRKAIEAERGNRPGGLMPSDTDDLQAKLDAWAQ